MKRVMLTRPAQVERGDDYVRGRSSSVGKVSGFNQKLKNPLDNKYPSIEGVLSNRGLGAKEKVKEEHVSLEYLLELSKQLPATEKKQLLARLSLASQTTDDGQDRDKDLWAQAVYNELARAFGRGDGAGQGPALVKRTLTVPAVWSPVATFMQASKLDDLKATERNAVYVLIAKLVVQNALYIARKINAPLSAKLVGSCSANVASIFDNAFPGYLEAGLAPMVARQLVLAH